MWENESHFTEPYNYHGIHLPFHKLQQQQEGEKKMEMEMEEANDVVYL